MSSRTSDEFLEKYLIVSTFFPSNTYLIERRHVKLKLLRLDSRSIVLSLFSK